MKRTSIITIFSVAATMVSLIACSDVKRKPSSNYMPDMAYSRAYETYSMTPEEAERLKKEERINFSNMPVEGTIARGEEIPYHLKNDSNGYKASALVANPLPPLNAEDMAEAKRLFNINCAICHGDKLDGNGPLYKGGAGPYAAAPAAFIGNDKYVKMPAGTMYHSVTYGLNMMGSYASQLSRKQRWMIIHYIKSKQAGDAGAAPATAVADTAATAKK
jgi:mono/diheme cytochrome c family protein